MDKVTQINIEGHNYELLAGGAVEGTCASQGADWTKLLVLPEGAALVDGMFLAIAFTYGNTAGFDAPKTVYSDDGVNFYRDAQLTDAITLPDPRNYIVTLVSGEEYSLIEYPVLYFQSEVFPVCDAKGHLRGGSLWKDGDTAVLLFVDDKFFVMSVSGGGGADINVYPTMADLEQDLPNLDDGQFVATEEGEASEPEWRDITDQVTVTQVSAGGSYTYYQKKFYMCRNLVKCTLGIVFNFNGNAGSNPLKLSISSPLFTTEELLSKIYAPSYYGAYIWTIGMNVYSGETNVITFRPNFNFTSGQDACFTGMFPVRVN